MASILSFGIFGQKVMLVFPTVLPIILQANPRNKKILTTKDTT